MSNNEWNDHDGIKRPCDITETVEVWRADQYKYTQIAGVIEWRNSERTVPILFWRAF